jgi:CheY-like chemotaxis protein
VKIVPNKLDTILVIDDEPAHRMLIKRAIKGIFPEVHIVEAENINLAKQQFGASAPIAITLDLVLGHESGFDFLKWVRQSPIASKVPLMVVTTSQLQSDISTANSLGADAFVTKNADLNLNAQQIQTALKTILGL